jgi:hypothetical protein
LAAGLQAGFLIEPEINRLDTEKSRKCRKTAVFRRCRAATESESRESLDFFDTKTKRAAGNNPAARLDRG